MTIQLLKQTRKMNCGQTAVAMLTGKSIAEVEKAFGHGGKTTCPEIIDNLTKMGCYADEKGFTQSKEPGFKLPELGFVRICYLKRSGGRLSTNGKTKSTGHLVVICNGVIYDPNGTSYPVELLRSDRIIERAIAVLVP